MFAVCVVCVCVCVCVCCRARLVTSWWLIGCRICILGLHVHQLAYIIYVSNPPNWPQTRPNFVHPPKPIFTHTINTTNKYKFSSEWALFVTYTTIQCIMSSEMCSLHLTHPSGASGQPTVQRPGAVGGSVPCSRVSPQSWTLPAGPGFEPTTFGFTSGFKSNALSIRPNINLKLSSKLTIATNNNQFKTVIRGLLFLSRRAQDTFPSHTRGIRPITTHWIAGQSEHTSLLRTMSFYKNLRVSERQSIEEQQ